MALGRDLAALPEAESDQLLSALTAEQLEALQYDWTAWARSEQLPPAAGNDGEAWLVWLNLAGRGAGKTRTGAEWVRSEVSGPTPLAAGRRRRLAIVGETAKDVRDVLIEGESGLLAVHPKAFRPVYESSKNRLTWPNGAIATLYNGTEPDQLRGPQFDGAWIDELAKYQYAQDTWDMLQFGMRLGQHPCQVVTTTPRPIPLIKRLLLDPKTAVTRGSTFANAENLAPVFIAEIRRRYEGTRLGRQELGGELIEDIIGALWRRSSIDEHRIGRRDGGHTLHGQPFELPDMRRILVSVDPAAKARENQRGENGAETGIVTCGLGVDGRGYVLADDTSIEGPDEWARAAVAAYDRFSADAIVAEINNGGDMVVSVIRSVRASIKVITVEASRGKEARAEPVSALYTQGRVSHVGSFPLLEDQLCATNPTDADDKTLKDRKDALVWGMTELFPQMVTPKRARWVDKWTTRASKGGTWMRG